MKPKFPQITASSIGLIFHWIACLCFGLQHQCQDVIMTRRHGCGSEHGWVDCKCVAEESLWKCHLTLLVRVFYMVDDRDPVLCNSINQHGCKKIYSLSEFKVHMSFAEHLNLLKGFKYLPNVLTTLVGVVNLCENVNIMGPLLEKKNPFPCGLHCWNFPLIYSLCKH